MALTQLGFPAVESETQAAVPEFGATCFQLLIDQLDCAEDGSPVQLCPHPRVCICQELR